VLNVVQCVGWGTFELVVIAGGLTALLHGAVPTWAGVLVAGAVTTALTLRPLGLIRVLRRYVSVLVVVAALVLAAGLLTRATPAETTPTSWAGFWTGVDAALAVAVSWVPLGADYSRHSRSSRAAFVGGFAGFAATQIVCYGLGLLALAVAGQDPDGVFDVFLALPLGALALAVLVLRESDQSFANVYSTAISIQNLRPTWDRRPLTLAVGVLTTAGALLLDVGRLSGFLYLIGRCSCPCPGCSSPHGCGRAAAVGTPRRWLPPGRRCCSPGPSASSSTSSSTPEPCPAGPTRGPPPRPPCTCSVTRGSPRR
jgi:NCS1 family nucleobase:cation symporter-1